MDVELIILKGLSLTVHTALHCPLHCTLHYATPPYTILAKEWGKFREQKFNKLNISTGKNT